MQTYEAALANFEDMEEIYMQEEKVNDAYFIGMQDGVAAMLVMLIDHCCGRSELLPVLRTAIQQAEAKHDVRV